MKKQLLLTCITLLSLTAAKAQKIYIKAGGGYMTPLAGQTFSATRWPYNGTVTYSAATGEISSYDIKGASFGAGAQGTIGIGLNVGKHTAFELNASVGIAPKTFSGTESYPAANGLYISETDKLKSVMPVILNPSIVLKTSGDLYLYTRVGLLLPLATKMKGEFEGSYTQNYIPGEYAGKLEYKTGFSAGAAGSVGMSVKLAGACNLWVEGSFSSLSVYLKRMTYTEYTVDGFDQLNDMPEEKKNIEYSTSGKNNMKQPAGTVPFSTIGLSVGLSVGL